MKFLALADIHGREDVAYMAEEYLGIYDYDAILVAGDITDFGPGEAAEEILNSLPTEVLAIPGNCDPPDVLDSIERSKAINVHRKKVSWRGENLAGLGGVESGFNMGITFSQEEAVKVLGTCSGCIFLVHQPPYGVLDEVGRGRHIGSRAIMKAVEMAKPKLVVSGHVHEARGFLRIGDTIFVNPGPAKDGYAALIDLNKGEVILLER